MKSILLTTKRFAFLLIFTGFVFVLLQCSKSEFSDDEEHFTPIVPLFDYSSIAFIARITENSADWSLCTMDKSGNNMRKIVDMTVACQKPVRSHCGTRLLFTSVKFDRWVNPDNSVGMSSEYELYIVNTDGTALTLIDRIDRTESGMFGAFDWSPDGKHIVYVKLTFNTDRIEDRDLILYNISNKTRSILRTEGKVCNPKFSPTGKYIAYCAEVKGEVIIPSYHNHHIYKMDVNGRNNRLIIRNAATPIWSPQGDRIAYSAFGAENALQIFVANADGSNQRQLTHTMSPQIWPGPWARDGNDDPQWMPDGKRIVYVSRENKRSEIFIMNADGSNQTRLTQAEFGDIHPEITPDGKNILFSSGRSYTTDGGIFVMSMDGNEQEMISKSGYNSVVCR